MMVNAIVAMLIIINCSKTKSCYTHNYVACIGNAKYKVNFGGHTYNDINYDRNTNPDVDDGDDDDEGDDDVDDDADGDGDGENEDEHEEED